jgi:DNA-binding beta-propeller fold protein YncE
VDQATHTVYVTTIGALNGWAVFSANSCNASVHSGCGKIGRLTGDQAGPSAAEVDQANNTLYTANYDNTVSAFDLRHCDASDLAGCATQQAGVVTASDSLDHALWLAVDVPLHSVYVAYQKDDELIVFDTRACDGTHLSACGSVLPASIHTGTDPESVILDPRTQTLYTANEVANSVSVIAASRCDAQHTSGCGHPAPTVVILSPTALAADPAAHTTYVASDGDAVSMIDTRTCNSSHPAGCARLPAQATVGAGPKGVAVDARTHTVYVANYGSGRTGTVSVIDDRTCNSTHSAGCAHLSTLQVPGGDPDGIAVDTATGTIYVATLASSGPNLVSVFNGATCNATHVAGCGQRPAVLRIGHSADLNSSLSLAVDQATNTLYATNVITNTDPLASDSVYVINGATCDGLNTTGCSQIPATIKVSNEPWGIAVDQSTNTIYTANVADFEHSGTVAVINGATCNGTEHSGCGQKPASVRVGFGAIAVTVDPAADTVYVANMQDTSVWVISGASCNGTDHAGCRRISAKAAVGTYPYVIAVDPGVGTAYVATHDSRVAVMGLTP